MSYIIIKSLKQGTKNLMFINEASKIGATKNGTGAHLNDNWDDSEGYYSKNNYCVNFFFL
jgi:hypothetical protein